MGNRTSFKPGQSGPPTVTGETEPMSCPKLAFLVVVAAVWSATAANAEDVQKLNALCKQEGPSIIAAEASKLYNTPIYSDVGAKTLFSFSTTIDACLWIAVNYLTNRWDIQDVFKTFIDQGTLFYCDRFGANNALLDAVRRLGGKVDNKPYEQWLDNGEGGLPKTNVYPATPYSRDKCEQLFKNKIEELRPVDEPKW
jgi:hypothetical protein